MITSFGESLRKLRLERGLRQKDLAGPGLSRSLISMYESGRLLPSYEILQSLATRLGVSVEVFFGGASEPVQRALLHIVNGACNAENIGDFETACELWDTARTLAATYHIEGWALQTKFRYALSLTECARWDEAVRALFDLLVDRDVHEMGMMYEILRSLGKAHRYLGQPKHAIIAFQHARNLVSPSDVRWVRMGINVASELALSGQWESALAEFEECIAAARTMGEGILEGWALIGWTTAQLDQGIVQGCEEKLARAEELARILQYEQLSVAAAHNRAVFYRLTEQWGRMEGCLKYALARTEDPFSLGQLLAEELEWATQNQNWNQVDEIIRKGEELPIQGPVRARLWLSAARSFRLQGDIAKAESLFAKAQEILRESRSFTLPGYQLPAKS
ncbi:MAG: hypothetical protein C7B47_14780 [Sulfobacillus thermosulfidooxidans]|uniref:HTH cro/C1-type domain-containing protein n=1 Tax=Sulfobacillus thermosulfidooxidans TaxID=28034 RepID=A0A2T2WQE0_SULTH|nr:MAG: hypothetical protein C7B47_14780 [Sulfobacillus thermosulfidooxidans]